MKIVTLSFACVALLNFEKVGAWRSDAITGHVEAGTASRNHHLTVLRTWADHDHTHSTEIEHTNANPQNMIFITKVVNGHTADWHLLQGVLLPDLRIARCNGPHGYAIVDFSDSERLYACMRPDVFHEESTISGEREQIGGIPVFLATVVREGRPDLEADLAPHNLRSALNTDRRLLQGESAIRMVGLQPVGHVRYIKSDPINQNHSFDVDGDLYNFPEQD